MKNYMLVVLIAVLQAPFSLPCHYGWTYDWTEVNEVMKDLTQAAKLEGAALLVADDFNEATKEPVLAYENYQNGYTRNTERCVYSATKWLTATVIMKIAGPDLEQTLISDWFDNGWDTYPKNEITLEQCLSHTSGLPKDSPILNNCSINFYDEVVRLGDLPLDAEPGTQFCYGGVSYQVAGSVAEQRVQDLYGSEYHFWQLFRDSIEVPLGIEIPGRNDGMGWVCSFGEMKQNKAWTPRIGGGLVTTPFDYMRFLAAFLEDSIRTSGTPILLPREHIDSMRTPRTSAMPRCSNRGMNAEYGIGCWLPHSGIENDFGYVMSSDGAKGTIPWINWKLDPPYAALFFTDAYIETVQNRVWYNLVPAVNAAYGDYSVLFMSGFDSDEAWPGYWTVNPKSENAQGTTMLTPHLGDRSCYLKGASGVTRRGYIMKTLDTSAYCQVILKYTAKSTSDSILQVQYSVLSNPRVNSDADWKAIETYEDAEWNTNWGYLPAGKRNVKILFRCNEAARSACSYVDHVVVLAR
nr:beta-lactamase family protein [Deltaproteobacteria bacterium]